MIMDLHTGIIVKRKSQLALEWQCKLIFVVALLQLQAWFDLQVITNCRIVRVSLTKAYKWHTYFDVCAFKLYVHMIFLTSHKFIWNFFMCCCGNIYLT